LWQGGSRKDLNVDLPLRVQLLKIGAKASHNLSIAFNVITALQASVHRDRYFSVTLAGMLIRETRHDRPI
jgi:hypothetical protein